MRRWYVLLFSIFLFLFAFFVMRSTVFHDPDFGWHLQFGRLITHIGKIPLQDTYSYTMPSYHFVDHEWGMDIFIAAVYDRWGIVPLILIFALLGSLTLLIVSSGVALRWVGMLIFLAGGTLFEFIGVRPQIISWVFLALLVSLLYHKEQWIRFRFFIPLLFLLWANLHGGFAIGMVVLGIILFGQMLDHRQIDAKEITVFFLSLFATLCNPYGYHLWTEVAKSALDPNLRWVIGEWYPAVYFDNIAFWLYIALSLVFILRYYRRFSVSILVIYGFLFCAAMASMRNIPLFVIVSFYPTIQALGYLYEEAGKHLYGKERFVQGYVGFFIVCLGLFLPQLALFSYSVFFMHAGQGVYPVGAVHFLQRNKTAGQIFTSYDWGGFMIWQLPEKKVFLDGRMPSWRNPEAPKDESTYAFGEYQQILQGKESFALASKKYHIDTVLVSANDLQKQQLTLFGIDVSKNAFLKRFFVSNMDFVAVVSQIKSMGWREVYHDERAVVFEKK